MKALNGMFAVGIADMRKGIVYIARNRFGIKPMYYMLQGDRIYFSLEMKSFLEVSGYEAHIDNEALNECLIFISAPQRTLIKEIRQMEPAN